MSSACRHRVDRHESPVQDPPARARGGPLHAGERMRTRGLAGDEVLSAQSVRCDQACCETHLAHEERRSSALDRQRVVRSPMV